MILLNYYKTILKTGSKEQLKEEMKYLILEIEEEQNEIKKIVLYMDKLKKKRLSGKPLKKTEMDKLFTLNDVLSEYTHISK